MRDYGWIELDGEWEGAMAVRVGLAGLKWSFTVKRKAKRTARSFDALQALSVYTIFEKKNQIDEENDQTKSRYYEKSQTRRTEIIAINVFK